MFSPKNSRHTTAVTNISSGAKVSRISLGLRKSVLGDEEIKASDEQPPSALKLKGSFIGSGTGKSPVKKKFNLSDNFKNQALTGSIDLSSKNLGDMHSVTIATLLKSNAATGVKKLDLSGNKITDEGVMIIIKAICDT